jgi:cation diffusion facilitator CzcD-associated flavoprotein CzcO
VLVVGAGVTGIYQLHRAVDDGFSAVLVEAGDGVGGTWFWNRYPGSRLDSESYTYGYLFSEELFAEWQWSEHFAAQPETERYLNYVVDRFDLRRHIRLGTRVVAASWDEEAQRWRVSTDDGATIAPRFLVAATGVLSVPYVPDLPGRDKFGGIQVHTGRWPVEGVDLKGRRVGVVGTSSSGVQVVAAVVDDVEHLRVFQRSPNWCTPLNNSPLTEADQAELRARFPQLRDILNSSPHGFHHPPCERRWADETPAQRRAHFDAMWNSPGFTKLTSNYVDLLDNPAANADWCDYIAERIRELVTDPAVAERLIPRDHRFGQKRPPFVAGYYEAFNRPHVELVDLREDPLVGVTAVGLETTRGVQRLDVIVWATGFDFGTGALVRMNISGRDGVPLSEHWADGPSTFLGLCTSGFPNLFFPGGPHAAAGNNPRYNGDQVDFIAATLRLMRDRGQQFIEVQPEAERRWTEMVDRAAATTAFGTIGQYVGGNVPGKPRRYLLNAGGRPKLHKEMARVVDTDYQAFRFR